MTEGRAERARRLLAEGRALVAAGDGLAARPLLDEALGLFCDLGDDAGRGQAEELLGRAGDPPPVVPPTG